jgi:hypothetical protein
MALGQPPDGPLHALAADLHERLGHLPGLVDLGQIHRGFAPARPAQEYAQPLLFIGSLVAADGCPDDGQGGLLG